LIDGISGYVEESVDSLSKKIHISIVDILSEMIKKGLYKIGKNSG